jgi:hypothetical protein
MNGIIPRLRKYVTIPLLLAAATFGLGGCGSSDTGFTPVPPPAAITISGVVSDPAVLGGTVFVFDAAAVQAALDAAAASDDRLASLAAASPIASLTRDPADGDQYSLEVGGDLAGTVVFLIFDNTDAEDEMFADTPPNLASIVFLGDAGASHNVNLSMQTTLVASLVLALLDPDGDGTIVSDDEIGSAMDAAISTVVELFQFDALGREIYAADFDPMSSIDADTVHAASGPVGFLVRAMAGAADADLDEAVEHLAADVADGSLDGDLANAGHDEEFDVFAQGACSSAAVSLRHACSVDVFDDVFELSAICLDIADEDGRADCYADVAADQLENEEECDDVFEARLALCDDVSDMAHEPAFGPDYAANFVDPLEIGVSVEPNPWFPLVVGNTWLYEGEGETIEVVVTEETKLIDGITCIVVIDAVSEDEVLIELTQDWYAQDVSGNVWYCGEVARNYEVFEGDVPEDAELVDLEGSWKAGRDGAEPGMLLPFEPQVGEVIRQEILFGEAEDFIEVLSLTASESAPGGSCDGTCLQTLDGTPLEPDAIEHKYYVSGLGQIVETNPDTGERVELIEATLN